MPTLKSLYNAKCKKLAEDIEDHINNDVLQQMNDDEPLSVQQQAQEKDEKKEKVKVPGGEKIDYDRLKDDVKAMFKKAMMFAQNSENHPDNYEPVGYCFSLIFKKGKAIDFSGGHIQTTSDVGTEEYFVNFEVKDERGMYQFYKINLKPKGGDIGYNLKNI